MEERKIVLIAAMDDDLERTKLCVESFFQFTNPAQCEIVCVVEPHQQEVKEWLQLQENLTIVEGEAGENYAMVRNCIIRAYEQENIFLLGAGCALLPDAIQNLAAVLAEQDKVGVVAATDYRTAENVDMDEEKICFYHNAGVLIRRKGLLTEQLLDEHFTTDRYCIMDLCMRGFLAEWKNLECKKALVYQILDKREGDKEEKDREYLVQKWGFNIEYYNTARMDLIGMMTQERTKPIRVLEIGCGTGATLWKIKKLFPNAEVFGLELSEQVASFGSKLLNITCGNVEDRRLDFPEEFFDYIVLGDVLEHLVNPEDTLLYLKQYLKKEGYILTSIPNIQHYTALIPLLFGEFEYFDAGIQDRTHLRFFTLHSIQNMFKRLQYEITEIRSNARADVVPQWAQVVIDKLCAISPDIDRQGLMTWQYCVKARKGEL